MTGAGGSVGVGEAQTAQTAQTASSAGASFCSLTCMSCSLLRIEFATPDTSLCDARASPSWAVSSSSGSGHGERPARRNNDDDDAHEADEPSDLGGAEAARLVAGHCWSRVRVWDGMVRRVSWPCPPYRALSGRVSARGAMMMARRCRLSAWLRDNTTA